MIVPGQKFCPFNGTISTKSEVEKEAVDMKNWRIIGAALSFLPSDSCV